MSTQPGAARSPREPSGGALARWRRGLRLGRLYVAQAIKARLQYRGDFAIEVLASLATQGCGLLVVAIIFESIPALSGWSRAEVFFVYGFALAAQALFESIADGFYWFADKYVIRGEMDRVLLRPVHPLAQILLENLSLEFVPDLALGVGVMVFAAGGLDVSFGPVEIALLGVMLLGATLVLVGIFLALASVSFWVEDKVGVLPPVYNLMAFARYPITIYHPALRWILTFVLPYGFVAFYPSTGLLGRDEFAVWFWATPLAGVVVFALGLAAFRHGLRRYRSTGS